MKLLLRYHSMQQLSLTGRSGVETDRLLRRCQGKGTVWRHWLMYRRSNKPGRANEQIQVRTSEVPILVWLSRGVCVSERAC